MTDTTFMDQRSRNHVSTDVGFKSSDEEKIKNAALKRLSNSDERSSVIQFSRSTGLQIDIESER